MRQTSGREVKGRYRAMLRRHRSYGWAMAALAMLLVMAAFPFAGAQTGDPTATTLTATDTTWGVEPVDGTIGTSFDVANRIGLTKGGVTATGDGVGIALVDTGIVDVPGLRSSNVTIGPDFSFEYPVEELRARDTNGHGTHLAGLMVGSDPGWLAGDRTRSHDRFLGIAPDAHLVSVKVGSADGAVDVTQVIAAINWVIEHKAELGIRVLVLAYGTDGTQDYRIDPLAYAVERAWQAGIVVVVAAGNDGNGADGLRNPAMDPFAIAVGASENSSGSTNTTLAGYSSGGTLERGVDIVAPGHSLISLRNPGSYSDSQNAAGRVGHAYVRASGTSQAAAVVAASVALMLEERPGLTPDQVKAILAAAAEAAHKLDPADVGDGYLRVDHALSIAPPADAAQTWQASDGSGSIDASRGSIRVVMDGAILDGEQDIFGNDWSGSSWSGSSWSGSSWSGSSWSGSSWSGSSWSGSSWSGSSWSGSSWSGSSWSGSSWSGSSWSGSSWSGSSWSGSSWSGASWSGSSWSSLVWEAEMPTGAAVAAAAGDVDSLRVIVDTLRTEIHDLHQSGEIMRGAEIVLTRDLDQADRELDRGDAVGAVQELGDFTDRVERLEGRDRIDDDDAAALIEEATGGQPPATP